MAYQVQWDSPEQSLIYFEISGKWALDDIYQGLEKTYALQDTVTHKVDIIIDMTNATGVPANMTSVRGYILKHKRQNNGTFVFVSSNTIFRAMADLFRKLAPTLPVFTSCATEAEARALIAKNRAAQSGE